MKASYLDAMGDSQRDTFPTTWPIPPSDHDPETLVANFQEGIAECKLAEAMGSPRNRRLCSGSLAGVMRQEPKVG